MTYKDFARKFFDSDANCKIKENDGANRYKTFIFHYNQVHLSSKSKQSIDMAGPCSILMDFDYTEAKL